MEHLHVAALTLVALSFAAYIMMIFCRVLARTRRKAPRSGMWPRVSILKPLAGLDDALDDNLESFSRLRGAPYELLLGVASIDDEPPAGSRLQRLTQLSQESGGAHLSCPPISSVGRAR